MSDSSQTKHDEDAPPPIAVQRQLARTVISPAVNANDAVKDWSGMRGTPFDRGLMLELDAQIAAIQGGNLDRPVALLAAHMETLNAVFYGLVSSGYEYRGHPYQEEKLRLALRVQAQLRETIQAIVDLKNPRPLAYVQQNIGQAVQVNNGATALPTQNPPNKLLEATHGQRLDTLSAGTTGREDQELVAVAQIDRAEVA